MGSKSGPDVERPEQTSEERDLARRGAEQWNKYVRDYVPMSLDTAERSRVTAGDRRDAAADAAAGAAQQTPMARTIAERTQEAGGMEGGAAIAQLQDAATQQGAMTGVGEAQGQFEQDQREHAGLMQAVATGHGVDALADRGYRDMAQGATQESIGDAQIDFANEMRRQQRNQALARMAAGAAIGGGIGMAGGGGASQEANTAATMQQAGQAYGGTSPELQTSLDSNRGLSQAIAGPGGPQGQQEDPGFWGMAGRGALHGHNLGGAR